MHDIDPRHDNVQEQSEHGRDFITCLTCGAQWTLPDYERLSEGDDYCESKPICNKQDEGPCKGDVDTRYSLGIYAGKYCDGHWETSGYRKEGREGFDPMDAGECYEEDDY